MEPSKKRRQATGFNLGLQSGLVNRHTLSVQRKEQAVPDVPGVRYQLKTVEDSVEKANDPTVRAAWQKTRLDSITFLAVP